MYKIDSDGHLNNRFSDGDPQAGTPATVLAAEWLNAVQDEIVNAVEGAGLTLDKQNSAQLLAAIQALVAAGGVPVGGMIAWSAETPPDGFLEMDGSAISRTTYADLFAKIGETYGAGDGSTTFNLPDFRGLFPRGWDHGAGVDPDAASRTDRGDGTTGDHVGTKQAHALEQHEHQLSVGTDTGTDTMAYKADNVSTTLNHAPGSVVADAGSHVANVSDNETRPVNVAVMWCIKY